MISAFCSPERGVRGVEDTLGWGLGADRVVLLNVLLDVRALLEGVFLAAVTLLERVEVERGFAVVCAYIGKICYSGIFCFCDKVVVFAFISRKKQDIFI